MEYIFLGSFFPHDRQDQILKFSRGPVANANNAFQHAILRGLNNIYPGMLIITAPNIGAYPRRYRQPFYSGFRFNNIENMSGVALGFCNVTILKHVARYINVNRELSKILLGKKGPVCIICYDLHLPFILAIWNLKRKFPLLKTCVIIPDLPSFTSDKPSLLLRGMNYVANTLLDICYADIDGFILLTKNMVERIPVTGKPWAVVEGMFLAEKISGNNERLKGNFKTIFYAGSLDNRNGVMRLVKAFEKIKHPSYKLLICGAGDSELDIKAAAAKDHRIEFKGQLPRSEVLALQQKANLLVNPRTPEGQFTRYSFPSKTIEYFASSIPVLMHRLDGVPENYFNFCYTIDDLSIDYLAKRMIEICEANPKELRAKVAAAKNFVMEQKTPDVQCKKIERVISLVMSSETPAR